MAISLALNFLGSTADGRHTQAWVDTPASLDLMRGIDVVGRKGGLVRVIADSAALGRLREAGHAVHVEVDDLEAAYSGRIAGPGWGIYHTLTETDAFLDSLHAACPRIAGAPFSLGVTHEGRPIRAMKISDNPAMDEDEPEVLIDGLHHAREVMSLEAILDFAGFLCARYDADPQVRAVVDQREIFLVPVVNPDGMAYNEQISPSGGGMWRKNRRDNGAGTFGVDLNRNYPYQWGLDDGSSPDPASTVYRGPGPASEPETQAMMALMISRSFVTHLSMHSFLGATLIPWGYTASPAPDDALLRAWAQRLSSQNCYTVAQPAQVLYLCSGMTTDYAYGETVEKDRSFSATIEIGGSGFWPAENEVPGLLDECRWPLLYTAQSAGVWLSVADWILEDDGDGRIEAGDAAALRCAVENRSILDGAAPGTLRVFTDDAYVRLVDAVAALPALAPLDTAWAMAPIRFAVDEATPQGHRIVLRVRSSTVGFVGEEQVCVTVGRPPALLFDDFENGAGLWLPEDSWGLTQESAYSPVTSLTDSPGGAYGTYTNSSISLARPVDLSGVAAATLSFWHRHDTEENYDHCVVEVSSDGGVTWRQVGPQYSGSLHSWRLVELPLDEFVGGPAFSLRFRVETDVSITADGWYIDDVLIAGPAGNLPPPAPIPLAPSDEAVVEMPTLSVGVGGDPDGDPLSCGFFLYGDSLLTTQVAASGEILVRDGVGSWSPDVPGEGIFWWRAFAFDGTERGLLSPSWRFSVGLRSSDPPCSPPLRLTVHPVPCRGPAKLSFCLPRPARTTLTIHDVAGRLVSTPADAAFDAGLHHATWDGRDDAGRPVGLGTYIARLSASGHVIDRRIVRIE